MDGLSGHIPDQVEQMIRYYGFYSNVSRELRQKENQDTPIPSTFLKKLFKPSHMIGGGKLSLNDNRQFSEWSL
jgi:hypothetical protein